MGIVSWETAQTWVPTFCERQSSFEFFFLISERSAKMPARTRSVAAAESDEVVDSNVNNNKACKRRKSRSRKEVRFPLKIQTVQVQRKEMRFPLTIQAVQVQRIEVSLQKQRKVDNSRKGTLRQGS